MVSHKRLGIVLVTTLALAATAFAVVPSVSAHTCEAQDPKNDCGGCRAKPVSLGHSHKYTDGRTYCSSGIGADGLEFEILLP